MTTNKLNKHTCFSPDISPHPPVPRCFVRGWGEVKNICERWILIKPVYNLHDTDNAFLQLLLHRYHPQMFQFPDSI